MNSDRPIPTVKECNLAVGYAINVLSSLEEAGFEAADKFKFALLLLDKIKDGYMEYYGELDTVFRAFSRLCNTKGQMMDMMEILLKRVSPEFYYICIESSINMREFMTIMDCLDFLCSKGEPFYFLREVLEEEGLKRASEIPIEELKKAWATINPNNRDLIKQPFYLRDDPNFVFPGLSEDYVSED